MDFVTVYTKDNVRLIFKNDTEIKVYGQKDTPHRRNGSEEYLFVLKDILLICTCFISVVQSSLNHRQIVNIKFFFGHIN